MSIVFIIASVLFFITEIRSILMWVSLWQRKEYRLDRFLVHLQETQEGKNLLFSKLFLLKILAILLYGFVFVTPFFQTIYEIFVTLLFAICAFQALWEIGTHRLKRPIITAKTIYLVFLPFVVLLVMYFFPILNEQFLWLLILDRLTIVFVAFFVLTLWLPTEFYRDIQIENAIKKISHNKRLIVIGITGSYGKSSTKEYIAQVLSEKFNVLKTKGTNNTPIGVAQTILRGLKKDTQIFVVEMGAYKKGEIAELCRIVNPRIGVLTGIGNQHVSLFRGIENTKKAKYELIEALPHNGLALFNGNNKEVYDLYRKTHRRKLLYTVQDKKPLKSTLNSVVAFSPEIKKGLINFKTFIDGEISEYTAPLVGLHSIENILPAIAIGQLLGMKANDIKRAVTNLVPLPKTMRLSSLSSGAYILDNTFSANTEAVQAILEYISLYKKKRIVVLSPLIELGKEGYETHLAIGKTIGTFCEYLLLTNSDYEQALQEGIEENNGKCKIIRGNVISLSSFILDNTGREDIIAFIGREAGKVLKELQ